MKDKGAAWFLLTKYSSFGVIHRVPVGVCIELANQRNVVLYSCYHTFFVHAKVAYGTGAYFGNATGTQLSL